jgi:peptidoglycan hydrolase-like protein with peptidoglycan-binding domain
MKKIIGAILLGSALCLACGSLVVPARAQTADIQQTTKHHAKKHAKKHVKKSKATERVRKAQGWLIALGYNPGPADGLMGPKTKAALIVFAHDRDLKANGKLTDSLYNRLEKEAAIPPPPPVTSVPPVAQPPAFYINHPDFYGFIGADYADPNALASPQQIPVRYGDMEISATQTGLTRQYTVTLNGQPVFHAEGQSSAINVSRTFNGENVDAVIFTAYTPGDSVCAYRHTLLVLRANSNGLYNLENCTRDYQAYTDSGSLYVFFPGDHVDGWSSGDMWRYEHGTLEKL